MAGRLTARRLLDLCGGVSCLAYAWLASASHTAPIPLLPYFGALAVAWGALILAFAVLRHDTRPFPLRRMILWCLLFRVIGLAAEPVLEDDHYRYLWDGRSSALTGSPYRDAPADHFDDPTVSEAFERVLDGINNPDVPTLYPPVAQVLFWIGYKIAPGEFAPIKLLLVLADLGTLFLLLQLLTPQHALLYAWCPLLIQETAFTGHVDSLGVLFLVAAIHARLRGRTLRVAIFAALAIATKLLAVLILPFLLLRARRIDLGAFAVVLALLYMPFVATGSAEGAGFSAFLSQWEFNSTLYAMMATWVGPMTAKFVGAACVGGLCIVLLYHDVRNHRGSTPPVFPRGDLLFACFFLLAPVVNPWYLLWMLPFACAYPSAWSVAALAGVSLSYVHGLFLTNALILPYHHPDWVRPVELLLIAVSAVAGRFGGPVLAALQQLKRNPEEAENSKTRILNGGVCECSGDASSG